MSIPNGDYNGLASIFPGTMLGRWSQWLFGLFWKGKVFDNGKLVNKILGRRMIDADVYIGISLLDGKDSIIIDYQKSFWPVRRIRDEIRQVSPGRYVGFAFLLSPFGAPRAPVVFTLDSNAPTAP
jgi:hypothetical protein